MQRMNPFVETNIATMQKYLSEVITDPCCTQGELAPVAKYQLTSSTGKPWDDLGDQAINTDIDLSQIDIDDLFRLHRLLHISAPSLVSELTIALNGPGTPIERRNTWSIGQVKSHLTPRHDLDIVGSLCSFTVPASEQLPGENERDIENSSDKPQTHPQIGLRGIPTGY